MQGICHICNQQKELSFEHVPPKSAFNDKRAYLYTGDDFLKHINCDLLPWDFSGIKPTVSQRGIGGYTLCIECNNNTGHWYGSAFAQFIVQGYRNIFDLGGFGETKKMEKVKFVFKGIYPQRIVKQILCMFFSINNHNFCKVHPDLINAILNPKIGIADETRYTLIPYINTGKLIRNNGITVALNIYTGDIRLMSELSALPFGFLLKFDDANQDPNNIIDWIQKYSYNDKEDMTMMLPVLEANTAYPGDFRTEDQIKEQRETNSKS